MAEAEGGSEQDDVSFLRTVSNGISICYYVIGLKTIYPFIQSDHLKSITSTQ